MNRQELTDYYNNNGVAPFHNVVTLDALKHLSELEGLPKEIKQDYYNQYEVAMMSMEPSRNWKLAELLYDRFEGSGPVTVGNLVNSYTYKSIVVSAVEIEIPYFEKMSNYMVEHKITHGVPHKRIVLDVTVNGVSTLRMLLNKQVDERRLCPFSNPLFTINHRDYAFLNQFGVPYNGIEAKQIPDILKQIYEKKNSYNGSEGQADSYLKMLVGLFGHFIDVDSILKSMK